MRHPSIFLSTLLLALFSHPSWAINKCVESGGKVVYTDEPCAHGTKAFQVEDAPPVSDVDRANAAKRAQQMHGEVSDIHKREAEETKARQLEAANAQKELELKQAKEAKAKEDERNAQLQRGSDSYYAPYPDWSWGRRKSYDDNMFQPPHVQPADAAHVNTGMGPNPSLNPDSSVNTVPNSGLTPMPPVPKRTAPVSPPKGNPGPPKTMYQTPPKNLYQTPQDQTGK